MVKALVLACVASCASSELDPPAVHTLVGRAAGRPVHTVVALRPTCGTFGIRAVQSDGHMQVLDAICEPAMLDGIAQHVRARLDFIGYRVIDAERVNAVTATRHEVSERRNASETERGVATGAGFEDATPREQLGLLRELGADAVLTTRVWVGAGLATSSRNNVIVQLRLTSAQDHQLIWSRRCELQSGGLTTDTVAIDRTARCAAQEIP